MTRPRHTVSEMCALAQTWEGLHTRQEPDRKLIWTHDGVVVFPVDGSYVRLINESSDNYIPKTYGCVAPRCNCSYVCAKVDWERDTWNTAMMGASF